MVQFIELESVLIDTGKILIEINHITELENEYNDFNKDIIGSQVSTDKWIYSVKETPQEILDKIAEVQSKAPEYLPTYLINNHRNISNDKNL